MKQNLENQAKELINSSTTNIETTIKNQKSIHGSEFAELLTTAIIKAAQRHNAEVYYGK